MKIIPKFNSDQLKRAFEDRIAYIESQILEKLKYIGEQFITNARNTRTYKDHTGNLRQSIGYIIMKNGVVVFEAFPGINPPAVIAAKEAALNASQNHLGLKGFVFIGIAGMQYASYVESKGLDVITGSSQTAISDLGNILRDLVNNINNK